LLQKKKCDTHMAINYTGRECRRMKIAEAFENNDKARGKKMRSERKSVMNENQLMLLQET
jgi:hypothetical protein